MVSASVQPNKHHASCTGIAQLLAKLRNLQHAVQMEMQEQAMTINA
jgi:hypothetical protein